jgi:hypothetical protein
MSHGFRFQDFIDQQRAADIHGIFIDDTGSPGLNNTPSHLHSARKSWVAVFVPKTQIAEVWSQLPAAINELKKETGGDEFHFAEIYMGRRQFKGMSLQIRLAIFRFMAYIFGAYRFPVFVQTLDPNSLEDMRRQVPLPDQFGPFNLNKHEDLALLFLLWRMKWYLENSCSVDQRLARVFVDEGYKKHRVAISIPRLETVFADGLVSFARSDSIVPLQLADFAAFCLNRTQLLIGKSELSQLDEQFLRIIEPLSWNFQNIPKIPLRTRFPENEPTIH